MNTFFPSTITEWNKLDLSIRNSASLNVFKGRLLQFVRPLENSVFTCHNPIAIKYFTRLRLGFSHLRHHKFKHDFLDAVDPFCSCSTAIENTVHYFLHCPNFSTARNSFLNEIAIVDRSIIDQDEIEIIQTFLYGNSTYSVNDNKLILDASIKYILETKRFDGPIFQVKESWSMHNLSKWNSLNFFFYYHYHYLLILLSLSFCSLLGNSMYVPGDCNILLISVCDL